MGGRAGAAASRVLRRFSARAPSWHDRFFSVMLGGIAERMWRVVDDPADCLALFGNEDCTCDTDEDCGDMSPVRMASRCSANRHLCEVRPWDVYDVNLYPNELELALATERAPGARAVLRRAGLCEVRTEIAPELGWRWTR